MVGGHTSPSSLEASYQHLSSKLDAIPDLMFELDEDGRHWDYRVLRPELLVAPPEQLMGRTVSDVMPAEAALKVMSAVRTAGQQGFSSNTHILLPTPSGERWFEISMARKQPHAGEGKRFIVLSRDITERKQQHLETERMAFYDSLTQLPNRYLLKSHLQRRTSEPGSHGRYGALLFLDLDDFKALNDSRGHHQGDQILKLVAQRLQGAVRDEDLVIRWGGDEFVVLVTDLADDEANARKTACLICDKITEKINMPYELDDFQYHCRASIGVRIFEDLDTDIEEIIRHADSAMYSSKKLKEAAYTIYAREPSEPLDD
ncbi:GGDEF domain-containing protein [Marinobacter hydrocarbonoclasticus]|nr:GGDEF domain-containing protein [Marinobacter nauticus]MBY6216075.1 GGDEF domain-containing protein [Marinobacter nauticus]